ncbi:hypothetical protein P7L78_21935 [Tistrella bauzanensis]|uniref:hypothetical protein n=1 Tax=Tistrella TaxID=171436 RepID=UPI0031F675E6
MILLYEWPSALRPAAEGWRPAPINRSGGRSLNSGEQVAYSGLSLITARITLPVYDTDTIRAARALDWGLMGRVNAVLVGPVDCINGAQIAPRIGGIPHSDGSLHSDGAGYSQGGVPTTILTDAALGATTLVIAEGSVTGLAPGVFLGLGSGAGQRLYGVVRLSPGPAPETRTLHIIPRLRVAVTAGAEINWGSARAPMRLDADDGLALETQLARYGTASATLTEYWPAAEDMPTTVTPWVS